MIHPDIIQPTHANFILTTFIVLAVVFGAVYAFVHTVIFSHTGYLLDLYVPSRHGSDTFSLDAGEFALLHWVALAVLAAEVVVANMFFKQQKPQLGYMFIMSMTVLASLYMAIILGNVLNDQWGSVASTLGVIAVALVGFGISIALVMKLIKNRPPLT